MREPPWWYHPHFPGPTHIIYVATNNSGPNWAEIVTALATALIALGLFVAAVQVRESRHSRHAAIAVDIAREWSEPDLVEARLVMAGIPAAALCEYVMALHERKHPHYFVVIREPLFFEWLGALERFGWLELDWIEATVGTSVLDCWEKWKDTVAEFQRKQNSDKPFCNFKALAARIARFRDPRNRWFPRNLKALGRWLSLTLRRVSWKISHQSHPFAP